MPFTAYRPFAAEGARVGLMTCTICGAAVLIDPHDSIDPAQLHEDWHALPTNGDET
jgi:hypothetical protein